MVHLFCDCEAVTPIWHGILQIIHLKYNPDFILNTIYSNGRALKIENLKSKQFYQLLEENKGEIELPVYWTKRINKEVNWKNVFIRSIVKVKENKLKEFNFKILYNLIPTKRNLFLWKLRNDDICEVCKTVEDLQHTFIYCQLNHCFYSKLKYMILKKFDLELSLNDDILLKLYSDSMIDDIITIALWSIHKLVMLRNVTGKDDREKKLWHLFCNEIFIRLEINKVYAKKGKALLYNIPCDLKLFM